MSNGIIGQVFVFLKKNFIYARRDSDVRFERERPTNSWLAEPIAEPNPAEIVPLARSYILITEPRYFISTSVLSAEKVKRTDRSEAIILLLLFYFVPRII